MLPTSCSRRSPSRPRASPRRCAGRSPTTAIAVGRSSGARALPPSIAARLAAGTISRIKVIGQGTAAVAGRAVATHARRVCSTTWRSRRSTATELSGFGLQLDMSDTLAIAVSQSGTTTDTNRTVDLLKARGAAVLAIVNRRSSDLTDKADGVMYTSDGRDVEMSVASTKAFYAQVAAGTLLACAISEAAGVRARAAPPRAAHLAARPARGDARRPRPATGDRRGGAPIRADEAVLGGRRQRRQQGRCRGAADQAQRAVLQGDRLRRHRGQEAHRPVVGAVDLRLRGRAVAARRPTTSARRWRSSAPTRRRRSSSPTTATPGTPRRRDDLRPADRPGAGVRAVDDGRPPLRLRGGVGHRRLGDPAARGTRGDRAGGRRRRAAPTRCWPGCAPRSAAPPTSTSTACATPATTATSRRAPPCASPACSATSGPTIPSRSTSWSPARSVHRRRSSTISSPPSRGRSRS